MKNIYKCLDEKIPSLCVFLDLSKAFDTVCHERLLGKLENYGFRGPVHQLLENYLKNRRHLTEISGHKSNEDHVTYGVPQGTVLGPVLFVVYMNSL